MSDEIIIMLYQAMADLTAPACGRDCGEHSENRCCSPEYCEMAKQVAKEDWGITLVPLNTHPTLPFMGEKGCIVPPHLRPLCTLHNCDINSVAHKRTHRFGPVDVEWTKRYFEIRNEIDLAEYKKSQESKT